MVRRSGGAVTRMAINYLLGQEDIDNTPLIPYSKDSIDFLNALSRCLFENKRAKQFPDIVTFAFWCRKGNILKLKDKAGIEDGRIGRGLIFHIAPANIPVNFAFSYVFSLLAGNANIVRLPSKEFEQIPIMCDAVSKTLENFPEIKRRTAWIRYPVDNKVTEEFSKRADGRMIWGGDETVCQVRTLMTKPKCVDLFFADRFSIGIIDGNRVIQATRQELEKLATGFYNDTWLVDQNACSSPRILLWVNSSDRAKELFWENVISVAKTRYSVQAEPAVENYARFCGDAISHGKDWKIRYRSNLCYVIDITSLPESIEGYYGKCGYFYEADINDLDEIQAFVTEKFQTITYYGIQPEMIRNMVVKNGLRGIDRVVPIGQALSINVLWDGYDIVRMLSRIVTCE